MPARRCSRSWAVRAATALMDGRDDGAIADAGVDAIVDAPVDAVVGAHPDTGSDAGSRLPPPYDEVARRLAEAECAAAVPCERGLHAVLGRSCAEAERIVLEDDDVVTWVRSVAEGRGVFDPAAFESCLAAMRDQGCTYRHFTETPECRRAFRGSASQGDSCWQTFDCTPALVCVRALACPGRCEVPPGDGQPCVDFFRCGPGLDCDSHAVCRPQAVLGESCGGATGRTCAPDLACVALPVYGAPPPTCVAVDTSRSVRRRSLRAHGPPGRCLRFPERLSDE